ncbi:tight adherence pilus pseudopilin TadF [Yersinia alsatica]|uniref:tight adherence pilus pseudopilin TadF n=1 Tax=Yersinia alsatica TaxID=2890317 RepID=UPI0032EC9B54
MHKKYKSKNIIINTCGAMIIEFSLVFLIIALFIKSMISIAEHYSTIGKLDRVSYSLAGIIRERSQLYNDNNTLTQEQVNQLKDLAESMLLNSNITSHDLAIRVDTIHFNQSQSSDIENRVIDDIKTSSFSVGSCESDTSLIGLTHLSSFSNAGRWIPLYQVTLCFPAAPWYRTLLNQNGSAIAIKSSSITVERLSNNVSHTTTE